MMFRYEMFDRAPFVPDDNAIDKGAHAAVARANEEQGAVLLRNDGVLPLDAAKLGSIAVIGTPATELPNGGGSSAVAAFAFDPPLQALARRAKVTYDPGTDAAQAAAVARANDVAIVFAADSASEGEDKTCLSLDCPPGANGQDAVIEAVAAANPRTVVVLLTAGPVLTPWRDHIAALLEGWFPGEQAGEALARVLFGDVDASGRLPLSFPKVAADAPTAGDSEAYPGLLEAKYKEGVLIGYRHYDARAIEPAFPFGFGLSYTSFRISDLKIEPARDGTTAATASVEVANTGARDGVAIPQLYLGLPDPSPQIHQPPRQLKGFQRLSLVHGRSRRVSFPIDARALSYWSTADDGWRVADGCYRVMAGSSSRDLPAEGVLAVGNATCPGALAAIPAGPPRRCTSRRSIRIHLRGVRGAEVQSVSVLVDGRRVQTLRGARAALTVRLSGRPRARVRVRVEIRTSRGTVIDQRVYRTCTRRPR
jgi:beta-glucosidase